MRSLFLLAVASALLAGCSNAEEAAEDRLEKAAETSANLAGPVAAAFGLSEAQLLDADIVAPDGKDLGDVAQVLRAPDGKVGRLLIELEGSDPDRYIQLPILGLTPVVRGKDTDLATTMTKADLAALPQVPLLQP